MISPRRADGAHADFRARRQQERVHGYSLLDSLNSLSPHDGKYTDKLATIYKQYQLMLCEKQELLGASSHVMDVLKKC